MQGMRSRWRRHASNGTRARRGRGISDVVATILLLALTVTLFASIFAFVTSFPSPPSQSNNQFQATLLYTTNLTYVSGLRIVHLAGPVVPGNALIYLKSANQPTAPEFASPYSVSSGLSGSGLWNLGQTWSLNFPLTQMPRSQGNITIYIVSQSQLLFTVILPGTPLNAAPTVVATSVSPATPVVGQSFTVYATLAGAYKANSVFVNLGSVPGCPGTAQKMTLNAQGQWTFPWSAGATKNGTYYGFVNASGLNNSGQTAVGAVTIIIANPGGSSAPFSVGVVAIPQPPTNYVSTDYFAAIITYTGSTQNAALNVSFWVNQTPHSPFTAHSKTSTAFTGPSQPLTISGPSTVTVYGVNPKAGAFSSWVLNSSTWVNASATITGVGTSSGSDPLSTPNYFGANVWYSKASPVHGCTTTGSSPTCGYVNATVWDNWTTALGGPSTLTFSGTVWISDTANGTGHFTVASTSVSQGGSVTVNPSSGRWVTPTRGTMVMYVTLTIYNGAVIVGWLYDTSTYSVS